MHRLDNHIRDIEPRIRSIIKNVPHQEEPSLQDALTSYGWILLDSWVAWRTLRFVLKDANISQETHEKWFQTPSSYTASQIKAIWRFEPSALNYLEKQTSKSFKELVDKTIQAKRNSSAHFSTSNTVTGVDSQTISKIFDALSVVFRLYEICAFFNDVSVIMSGKSYECFSFVSSDGKKISIKEFRDNIDTFSACTSFTFSCQKCGKEYYIIAAKDGCVAGIITENSMEELGSISNDIQAEYKFFDNKGYYQNIELFAKTVVNIWEKD